MNITIETATVYKARGKRYLTKRGAVRAEAVALIKAKHPTEKSESDGYGRITMPGFHWSELPKSEVLLRRLSRLINKSLIKESA